MNENQDSGDVIRGEGGELHQLPEKGKTTLTTQQGVPVSDNQNSLKAGVRGPTLMEDQILREKLFHFDHERIPERVVHARGYAAHGYFENYENLSDITCADLFQRKGEKTPVFTRFSTVAGAKGSPDLARDVRGFATKFYTKEGNWDLVGNNIPVFFIQDAMKFPDLIHAAKEAPDRAFPQAQTAHDNFWDFISLTPESMHMVMWAMSDRAIPRSFRFMEGFGVHTFLMLTKEGKASFVKFHWKPLQGLQSVAWNEALKINGMDPDFHRRDLWESIEKGDYPEWELGIQVFDETFLERFEFDVLDATKLIPEEQVPVTPVGKMVLNKNVDNFFAETEQVAFCTQNIVPGIDHSADPLLQGRNFSYLDTQLKRLGSPNFTKIPINQPKCPMHNFHQDGHMAVENPKGRVNYEPNSWEAEPNPRACPMSGFRSHSTPLEGEKVRVRSETFADHYSQARMFFNSQTPIEQAHIVDALSFELSKVAREDIRLRMLGHLRVITEKLASAVAENLGVETLPDPASPAREPIDLPPSEALSILLNSGNTFKGRKVGVLLTNKVDATLFRELEKQVKDAGASLEVVAPMRTGITDSKGKAIDVDHLVDGGPSVLFDAVAVIASKESVQALLDEKPALDFLSDAYYHCKFIAFNEAVSVLLDAVGLKQKLDAGCFDIEKASSPTEFIEACKVLRFWEREQH